MDIRDIQNLAATLLRPPVHGRIIERAARGAEFRQWAVSLTDPAPGTSLQLDDEDFLQGIGTSRPVAHYSRFPVSQAAEHLAAVDVLISDWFNGAVPPPPASRSWPSSVMVLCRSAMEAAARTIWLIGDPSRETRRLRCAAEAVKELGEMHKWTRQNRDVDAAEGRNVDGFAASEEKLKQAIAAAESAAKGTSAPGFTAMTLAGAAWIDANPPVHESELLKGRPFEAMTKAWYSIGSSYTHGYNWTLGILRNQDEQFGLVADLLMSAVLMTESAVALFESQMLAPAQQWHNDHLPARLGPSIADWAPRYSDIS
ncbi:hypothetical protein [Nocardia noduli]|uniref:hypothetical protein n=1 Tax=Nocardia noduli TaxID=2815722 RepID=UPI001C2236C2|nr:hypothetical protein [Nocardia noduli]